MKTSRHLAAAAARIALLLASLASASAQTAPAPAASSTPAAAGDTVTLSPFEVVSDNDRGYQAANTLGATRTNVAIRDLPMQMNVVTEQLMLDRALFDLDQVLDVIPGTARTFNEFVPQANIRGFDSSAAMRNGVRGLTTPDMNSIARVETLKGPAALLYGQTQPGGVINYITKNPSPQRKTTLRLSAGSDELYRADLDTTGPINRAKTFNYRLGATYYTVEKGERQRSLDRVSIAPMLQWKPFAATSIVVRYSTTHDNIRPAEGLALKPTGALNRGGDPAYFYPFNKLDPVDTPQWVDDVGPGFIKDSPSSYRDYKPVVWELEATQRLNQAMDLRLNFAYHRRARSSIREGGTGLVNPWTQTAPTIASLGGFNSWNLDGTRGDPFPEARHTYEFIGRGGVPSTGVDPLSDTRLLNGQLYLYNPSVATLQYTPGKSGWRRTNWIGNNRRERRVNGQIDVVTRFKTGPLNNTLLTGFEHNEDRVWENNSTFVRDPALGVAGATLYTVPGTTTQVTNVVDYWYNIYSPASTAARDAFAQRNLVPLHRFASNGANNDQRFTSDAFYANWSATFNKNRGRVAIGGRFDDVSARTSTKNPGINPITFDGIVTSTIEGARQRTTPQGGISYRVTDPVSVYMLYSQSVNPRVTFQPGRTAARETQLINRYQQDGLGAPNLDALPWGQLLEPEFGKSFEYGVKTDLFENKAMINVAYYIIDKKNVSRGKGAADPDSAAGFLDLSGAERARGIDIDFYIRPVRELQIGGGGLFNKTEIVAVNATTVATPLATTFAANTGANAPFSLLGRRTPNAAKYSGNAYARYEFASGPLKNAGFGLSYIYMAPRREGDNLRWSESWSRYDVNASYRTKLFNRTTSFSLVVKNATSREYRVDRDTFAQPRTFVGTMSLEF
ncbi:TonB-dependent siderophore receptor [Horticoccus sp. 23ND18S-11]|uniref:TonB-dependent siderophore receptor n=1 Tax=Horticoccus sp. 23ND18S-11 TaxID=3391832 RepID=UPI0039C99DB8